MISVFLGAGHSRIGGVPLASELFDRKPIVDRITRRNLVERVHVDWISWHRRTGGASEEYLAYLHDRSDQRWSDTVWYVGLVIALATAQVEKVGAHPTVTRHNIDRTTQVPTLEEFWTTLFRRTEEVAVITTNYDILAERGLRHQPRPRVPRPGFNYGVGAEQLAGGGYPSYSHIQRISVTGSIPLLKLHGSVSWAIVEGKLVKYHDCQPAVRGDPAIVAPVKGKSIPNWLNPIWKQASLSLSASNIWIVIGYSLPEYDNLVRMLMHDSALHSPMIHILDPDPLVYSKYKDLIPSATVASHPGLPEGIRDLSIQLRKQ